MLSLYAQDYYSLGIACFENYDLFCAKQHFEGYLIQNPNHQNTIEYLGDIAVDQKDWETAIAHFKTLVTLVPSHANYQFKYGGAIGLKALNSSKLRAIFLIDDIKEHFLESARLDKNHIEVRWALVELYVNLPSIIGGGMDKARRYAEELYQLSTVDGLMAKGYIALKDDDPQKAAEFYKASVVEGLKLHEYAKITDGRMQVTGSSYAWDRNQLHYQIGKAAFQYEVAMTKGLAHLHYFVAHYGVQDHITKDWGYYYMAKLYHLRKDHENATLALEKALKLRPDFVEALQLRKEL